MNNLLLTKAEEINKLIKEINKIWEAQGQWMKNSKDQLKELTRLSGRLYYLLKNVK